jgi:hypothetical protein
MNNTHIPRIFSAMSLVAIILCSGCRQTPNVPAPTWPSKAQIEATNFQTEAQDPTDRIVVSDTRVYPDTSGERILGDLKPLWVVEGRVTSNLVYANADKVVLKVRFVDEQQTEVLDTAEVTVNNINPQDTKAFRNTVPLLPPKGKRFSVAVDVSSVDTSPAKNPYPFYK